jgi:hypothetical protein
MPNDFGRKGKANMRLETGTASGNAKPTLQAPTAIATCSWKSPWGIAAKKSGVFGRCVSKKSSVWRGGKSSGEAWTEYGQACHTRAQ